MKIFISPIGKTTEHVKTWLAEESGVQILWLIHSKKDKADFPKIAKKLKKDLQSAYPRLKIKLKTIDSAFEIDSTMDAISEIIHKEKDDDHASVPSEFTLNITGGTNAMAAATMISATWYGTKAHYVLEPQKGDPEDTQYVRDLPVKSIGTAKMKDNQLTILKMINESNYEIPNTPTEISQEHKDITKGTITRKKLLEAIESNSITEKKNNKKTLNKRSLETIAKALEKDGYIESIKGVEQYVYKNKYGKEKILGTDDEDEDEADKITIQKKNDKYYVGIETQKGVEFIEWPLKTRIDGSMSRYVITPAGKRATHEAIMFD
jgi:ribosomal protein S8